MNIEFKYDMNELVINLPSGILGWIDAVKVEYSSDGIYKIYYRVCGDEGAELWFLEHQLSSTPFLTK